MSIVICNICGKQHKGNFETCTSCINKEQQMSIEIGSKWVKDGEVVEVKALTSSILVEVVWYSKNDEKEHVITKDDFLEQYKPYEPVYEFEFIAQQPDGIRYFTHFMTDKEMGFFSFQNDCAYYQRLDFTKRERKQ